MQTLNGSTPMMDGGAITCFSTLIGQDYIQSCKSSLYISSLLGRIKMAYKIEKSVHLLSVYNNLIERG